MSSNNSNATAESVPSTESSGSTNNVPAVASQSTPITNRTAGGESKSSSNPADEILCEKAASFQFGDRYIGMDVSKREIDSKGTFVPFKKRLPAGVRRGYVIIENGRTAWGYEDHPQYGPSNKITFKADDLHYDQAKRKYMGKEEFTEFFYRADDFFRQMVIDHADDLFEEYPDLDTEKVKQLIDALYVSFIKKGKKLTNEQKAKQAEANKEKKKEDQKTYNTWAGSIETPLTKTKKGLSLLVADADNNPVSPYDITKGDKLRVWEQFSGFYVKKSQPFPSVSVRHFCGKVQFPKSGANESDALDLATASGMTNTGSIRSIPLKRKNFSNNDAVSSSSSPSSPSDAAATTHQDGDSDASSGPSDRPTSFEHPAAYQVNTTSKRARTS